MSKSYIAQVPIKALDAEGRVIVIQPGEVVPEVVGAQDRAELESVKAIAPAASAPQADASEADAAEAKPAGKPGNKPNTGKEGKK